MDLKAQSDTLVLHAIEVFDELESAYKSSLNYDFDSAQYHQKRTYDAGDFLNQNTSIFVKNYGPGSSSSLSYRGGSAYQTKIYWEGISIDNAMLGQSDASLIPSWNFENIQFLKSGNSLAMGAGGIGGILNLNSSSKHWHGTRIAGSNYIGDFGQKGSSLNLMLGNGQLKFETYLNYNQSDNDFTYENEFSRSDLDQRENAAIQSLQFIPRISLRKNKHELALTYWLSKSNREVPSAMGTNHGEARQWDENHRMMLSWKMDLIKTNWQFKSVFSDERLDYTNQLLAIESKNRVKSSKSLFTQLFQINKYLSNDFQIKYDFYAVETNNYQESIKSSNIGLYDGLSAKFGKFLLNGLIRYEYWSTGKSALMPSIYMGYKPFKEVDFLVFGNASYNVRFPSFNELYWQGIANPDLKHEKAWMQELGLDFKSNGTKKFKNQFKASVFNSRIYDMIIWIPDQNGNWKPQNNNAVLNQGIELESKHSLIWKKLKTSLKLNYMYTSSTILENKANEKAENKQQIYVPKHKFNGCVRVEWHGYYLLYDQVVTGEIYTTSDNENFIPLSLPANFSAGKNFRALNSLFDIQLSANNVFNENYQYVLNMPMPLRNYMLTINYYFN